MKIKWRLYAALLAICLILVACAYLWSDFSRQKPVNIKLYGASPDGPYTKTMRFLAQHLKKNWGSQYSFDTYSSDGSIENVRELQTGKANIALIQEDVAHYYYNGGHSLLQVAHKNNKLQALCYGFYEYLFIIAREDKSQLKELDKIHIGSFYGGSRVTAINIKEELRYHWQFDTSGKQVEALTSGKVDAIIVLAADINHILNKLRSNKVAYRILDFDKMELATITTSFPFYRQVETSYFDYRGQKRKLSTIATRALLTVNKNLPTEMTKTILEVFTDREIYRKFSEKCSEIKTLERPETVSLSESLRFSQFPLPMHPLVFELYWGNNVYWPFFIAIMIILCCCLLLLYIRREEYYLDLLKNFDFLGIRGDRVFIAVWGYVLLLGFVLLYLIIAASTIKYLEIQAFIRNEISNASRFIYMGFRELATWILVFTVTGYEDEIFPQTQLGKIMASSIRIVTLASAMFVLGRLSADYLTTLLKDKKMVKGYNLKDHIVICNWNEKGFRIVEELHSPLLKDHEMARPIIIIAEAQLEFPDTPEFEDVFWIPGDPISDWKLRNGNVQDAHSIIILANYDHPNPDTHTIMVTMEIGEVVEEMLQNKKIDKIPHLAAEILDGKNVKYILRAGAQEVVSGNELGIKLLAQSAVTPGITTVIEDILEYSSESNEIYIVPAPESLIEKNANFLEISEYLLENRTKYHNAVLLGIHRSDPLQILVNPEKSEFTCLQPGEQLIVMARKRPIFS